MLADDDNRVTITGRQAVTNIPPNSTGSEGAPSWAKWIFLIYAGAALLVAAAVFFLR
jgi:hypothetical protein